MSRILACLLILNCSGSFAAPLVVETDPLTPEQQREKFHLPAGFEIQLVVANPDIGQPMNLAFDAAGRLWVTHSVEYPYPVEGPGVEPRDARFGAHGKPPARDKVTILSDFAPDGKARKVQHFATGLNIPIGVLPLVGGKREARNEERDQNDAPIDPRSSLLAPRSNAAIVFSIPNLTLFTDTNGDDVADEQKVLYGPFGNVDTHGMVNSLTRHWDGWIYANHGFRNTSKVKGTDGHEITMNSGNTFRFKADGSRIEQVTWGEVNPFGMTVDRWGNFYNADCHSMPLTCLIPGAYYQSFGKPHDGLGFGPDMIDHNHGSTGICGVAWYEAEQLPKDYHDCIFLCNPVNGTVHRDRIVFRGSSPRAETQPEFITCDDGWFRPVDVKLGPDGALYIADFYNCIIGHYEVPLDHPRRDREMGRVWRVVWTGERASRSEERRKTDDPSLSVRPTGGPPAPIDLTTLTNDQLIDSLGDPNIVVRTLATNLLVDREAGKSLRGGLGKAWATGAEVQRAHSLWVLERTGNLLPAEILDTPALGLPLQRVHLARFLGEASLDDGLKLLLTLLTDPDPRVQRVAAGAFGRKSDEETVKLLYRLLRSSLNDGSGDTHLAHAVRIALKDQIPDSFPPPSRLSIGGVPTVERNAFSFLMQCVLLEPALLTPVILGSHTEGSAVLAFNAIPPRAENALTRAALIRHAVRYGDKLTRELVMTACKATLELDVAGSVADIHACKQGLLDRGESLDLLQRWGQDLTNLLLTRTRSTSLGWTYSPQPGPVNPQSAFVEQERPSVDEVKSAKFFSTLPAGERRMGTYRSDPFTVPQTLTFYISGHNGLPGTPLARTSFVRLVNADTGVEIARTHPPRNDVAQKVTWSVPDDGGRRALRGYVEIVDGDSRDAYAWLAVGRFSMEALNPQGPSPVEQAVDLIASLHLTELEPKLNEIMLGGDYGITSRLAAAQACLKIHPDSRKQALYVAAKNSSVAALQDGLLVAIDGQDEVQIDKLLTDIMKAATGPEQGLIAQVLINDRAGGKAFLKLVESGSCSPLLLARVDLVERLKSLGIEGTEDRISKLTSNLPPVSEQIAVLIGSRRATFDATPPTPENLAAGAELFKKHCAACHQFKGEGNRVGPQLDGIGQRGADRLLEDILDPNRNVDGAFRSTAIALTDGRVLTGLKRREEGATIVFADSEGKEFTVSTNDIEAQRVSALSLMPVTLGEKLSEKEFASLLRFLVAEAQAQP